MTRKGVPYKWIIVLVVIIIALIAYVPPHAEFMPKDKRFPYITFPLLPPLLAIALCMVTGEVLPSLFLGIWIGALMVAAYNPITASLKVFEWYVENAINSWNATILLFDFVIGAWVGLLYASGALHSAAESIIKGIKSSRTASIITSVLGLTVFFDDYTNTIVVGNASRPVTDKVRISREMLSYIVDSTAAPVAGLFVVSTWIGYEVSLINDAIVKLQEEAANGGIPIAPDIAAYYAWLNAVPYHFYSILAIILVFWISITRRHFGPMLMAEHRAVKEGKVLRDGATPLMPTEEVLGREPVTGKRASGWLFVISAILLISIAILGLWYTGGVAAMEEIGVEHWWEVGFAKALEYCDAAKALFWASLAAYFFTLAWILLGRNASLRDSVRYTVKGMYLMLYANAILLHAWTIKTVVDTLGTADYVVHGALTIGIPALLVPLIIYMVSMFISFNTGTSWGTFGIMMPIAVPMAWKLALIHYPGQDWIAYMIMFAAIGAVFGGGIFGDHCSPISDTTIMSSMFSGCDHIDHVKTQLPYALLAGLVGIVLYIMFAMGLINPVILLAIGVALLLGLHYLLSTIYAKKARLPPVVPDYKLTE
ncbi:MAG: Na+/H+ antiporter NhaC family protein [Desulfurococcaceae archaeon]